MTTGVLAANTTLATVLAWIAVAAVAAMLVTQAVGWSRSVLVAVAQALTPLLAVATVFAAIVGRIDDDTPLLIAGVATTAGIAALVAPALRRGRRSETTTRADAALSVFHGNLLYTNVDAPDAVAAAVLRTGADVLALSELNPDQERALVAAPGAARYPHRIGHASRRADGMALWSVLPLGDVTRVPDTHRDGLAVTFGVGGHEMRLVFAHPHPPTNRSGLRHWQPGLDSIQRVASSPGPPTLIVADLNAARWHPPFRRLLRAGWRDAHEEVGRGLSTSWPTSGRLPVPFVRLDHALVGDGLDVVGVEDLAIPGSDHAAFVVTVAVSPAAARAAR